MNTTPLRKRFSVIALVVLALSACDSGTNLDAVTVTGTWNGAGSLQQIEEGRNLALNIRESGDGSIAGWWERRGALLYSGAVTGTASRGQQIRLTLERYSGEVHATFTGELTRMHRMVGSITGLPLDGPAVFLRSGVADPAR